MTDLGVSGSPALVGRPLGWGVVVLANLLGGVAAVFPAMLATTWLVDVLGGTPAYSSDPGLTTALGQVSTLAIVVGFLAGNASLQWALTGWRTRWWVVALVSASLPAAGSLGHHALLYGPS